MKLFFIFFIALYECGFILILKAQLYEGTNTNSYLNTLQIIEKYGYPAEAHVITTADDYFLELHHIPYGKNQSASRRGIPIFLQHGFLGSSADFVLIGPEKGLPFLLADMGYDVWLGNLRGNTYSRGHKTLTPDDKKFWDFSWHELGYYDVPAQIDYICKYTKHDDLIYVGYSMGTTVFFVMTSLRPEYQHKIRGAFLMAAVAYLKNTRTPFRILAPFVSNIQVLSEFLTDGELLQQSTLYRYLVRYACTLNKIERDVCRNLIFLYTGIDPYQFNEELLPSLLNHLPAGGSTKSLVHYIQLIQSGEFRQFDYGPKENTLRYKSPTPPEYRVEDITTPLYFYEGVNDYLSTIKDVQRLLRRLPNVISTEVVDYPYFNHADFVFAKNVKSLLYDKLLQQMGDFLNETITKENRDASEP